jgi:hypothetical protein
VPPARLKDIGVWGTMLEGRLQPVPRRAAGRPAPRAAVPLPPRAGARTPTAVAIADDRAAFWTNLRLQASRHAQAIGACRSGEALRTALTAAVAERLASTAPEPTIRLAAGAGGR